MPVVNSRDSISFDCDLVRSQNVASSIAAVMRLFPLDRARNVSHHFCLSLCKSSTMALNTLQGAYEKKEYIGAIFPVFGYALEAIKYFYSFTLLPPPKRLCNIRRLSVCLCVCLFICLFVCLQLFLNTIHHHHHHQRISSRRKSYKNFRAAIGRIL